MGKFDGYQAEELLSAGYKKQLRKRYSYVLDMPIQIKKTNHPKYRMIHVCNHEEGCLLMAQNMLNRTDELVLNIQLLQSEIPKLRNRIESVQLCFTTDPFMYEFDEIAKMSKDEIRLLNLNGIKCTVLTKGILPLELGDKKNYSMDNEYGITLISLDEKYREKMEPYAASYQQRIDALKALHDSGCKTWISMEPYPTPNLIDQDINELLEAVSFTDKIIFGRTNYCIFDFNIVSRNRYYCTGVKV